MINKNVDLDKNGLLNLQKEISKMGSKMKIAQKQICKELSEYGVKKMQEIYDNYELFGNYPSTIYTEGTDTEKKIIMRGPQAIYDEFGTGTLGEQNPHPIKSEFNLTEYNSGRTIRPARGVDVDEALKQGTQIPEGGLFWTYRNAVGDKIYTQGTPAQKEGYDSMMLTKSKSPQIIKRIMKEVVFND